METSLPYAVWRARLRDYLSGRERLLEWFRMARYALVQGPWQPWLVRWYERHAHNPPLPVAPHSLFPDLDAARAVRDLDADAYARGFTVPGDVVGEIAAWAREVGRKRIDEAHLDCEPVRLLAHDPRLVAVARGYLHAEPVLLTSKLYWTVPPADPHGRQLAAAERGRFHYDLADVRALTVFVYLTDVDAGCGPHVVVRGTQRRRTPMQILRRTLGDDEVRRRYGDRIVTVLGPRGTGWFEDITCYHKQAPGERPRLMLSLIYSLHRPPLRATRDRVAATRRTPPDPPPRRSR